MFSWAPYAFFRVTAALCCGILFYKFLDKDLVWVNEVFFVSAVFLIVLILLQNRFRNAYYITFTGIVGLFSFFLFGLSVTQNNTEKFQFDHILKVREQVHAYQVVLNDYVLDKEKVISATARVIKVNTTSGWKEARGNVQLSFAKDGLEQPLKYGDVILVKGGPQAVLPPLNPGGFDYKAFLENRQVFHQQYVLPNQFLKTGNEPPSVVLQTAIRIRNKLDAVFRSFLRNPAEKSIASALVLGVKDYLPQDLKQAYSNTGTMHVLAVSGLHVGLLFVVLGWLFSRFRLGKIHPYLSTVLILFILWTYAFVTGLTPSVLRAVFMFSLVLLATLFKRRTNIYNSIAVAAFCLLAYNPYYLFEVSFQLSFLAVLGIVYIQPRLYRLLDFDNWLADKIWVLFTVSVAAQISTLPVSLFFFHQFPTFFWLANIPVIPLATLVLWSGLALLVFSWIPFLATILAFINEKTVAFMNLLIGIIDSLPQATIPVFISVEQMWIMYAFLLALLVFFALKRLFYLAVSCLLLVLFSFWQVQNLQKQATQNGFIVYAVKNNSVTAFYQGMQVYLHTDSVDPQMYKTVLQPHWQRNNLDLAASDFSGSVPETILPDGNSMIVWQGQRILFLKHPPKMWPPVKTKLDFVVLQHNVKVMPEELLTHYQVKKIILDSSNKPWYRRRMATAFENHKQEYYPVSEKGAFVYSL